MRGKPAKTVPETPLRLRIENLVLSAREVTCEVCNMENYNA
jgi:hypothetical protein